MAVELDVPAVLLAQMNRDSDRRLAPYLPILSDLRNSGAIEQVADQVIFMDGGVIVEQGSPEQVFENPQQERTKEFLQSYRETSSAQA